MSAHLNSMEMNGKTLMVSTDFGFNPGWIRSQELFSLY